MRHILCLCLTLCLVTSCSDREKESRALFNQAILQWEQGNLVKSDKIFKKIEREFLDTAVATEAIKERKLRKEKYKRSLDMEKVRLRNQGAFSSKVISEIDSFYDKHKKYPNSLSTLPIYQQPITQELLTLCSYERALFDYGFKLDCKDADIELYKKQKRNRVADKKFKVKENNVRELKDFPKAKTTWGKELDSGGVPDKGFKAVYINTNRPNKVVTEELVDDVSINFVPKDFDNLRFNGLNSEDFGGYWVGYLDIKQKTVKQLSVSQSWSKTRIIIDGKVVYKGGGNSEILLSLDKGRHLMEVEYVNNWHTIGFSVSLLDNVESYTSEQIRTRLSSNILSDYKAYYVGVYESSSKDNSITLNVEKTTEDVVLFLSSHSPVKWELVNPFGVNIRAIVYGSTNSGSSVTGDSVDSALLLPYEGRIGSYGVIPSCNCHSSYHCSGGSIRAAKKRVEYMSSKPLSGFSGKYQKESFKVPDIIINKQFMNDLAKQQENNEKLRKECAAKNDPDFESMFDKKSVN